MSEGKKHFTSGKNCSQQLLCKRHTSIPPYTCIYSFAGCACTCILSCLSLYTNQMRRGNLLANERESAPGALLEHLQAPR